MTIIDFPVARRVRSPRPEALRVWLWCVAVFVIGMVVVGGATRLTGSGLSITEWKPIHGVIPPLNEMEWQDEFSKYQQIPQFRLENSDMTLAGFKGIFWWEWAHRLLGRVTGIVFILPFLVFLIRGMITKTVALRLSGLFVLGAIQGGIGWWMVASGLQDRVSVSQYRLAIHLTLASLILAATVQAAESFRIVSVRHGESSGLRKGALALVGLVLAQIFMGGIVAGLHAGLTYNTWPLMDGAFIPSGLFGGPSLLAAPFEDVETAQFLHRMIAYAVLLAGLWHFALVRRDALRPETKTTAHLLLAAILIQVVLGVATLLLVVPLPLALAHQFWAIILLVISVVHATRIREGEPTGLKV